jgi:hypothetical protein
MLFDKLNTVHKTDKKLVRNLCLSRHKGVVAGGAALRWFQNQAVEDHDIDIWFPNEDARLNFYLHDKNSRVVHDSKNATTYLVDTTKIQLIKNPYTSIMDLVKSFDITVCQIATDGNTWYYSDDFISDLKHRRLRISSLCENSIRRVFKYWNYGFIPDDDLLQSIINNPDTCWDYSKQMTEEDYNHV